MTRVQGMTMTEPGLTGNIHSLCGTEVGPVLWPESADEREHLMVLAQNRL